MNKSELVDKMSGAGSRSKVETREILDRFLEVVSETLAAGDNIEIRGFGSFKVKKRKEQTARNPGTGEKVIVPSRFVPKFKPSKQLLQKVRREDN